jgi:hypothetical protein
MVTATRNFDHIKPVLRGLHWLPVRRRVTFKIVLLANKCLHGLAPLHVAELCQPVSGSAGKQRLQSAVFQEPEQSLVRAASLSRAQLSGMAHLLSGMAYLPTYGLLTS